MRKLPFIVAASAIYGIYRALPRYGPQPRLHDGLRQLAYAYRECDDQEWLVCDGKHRFPADGEEWPDTCPRCGGELKVRPWRSLMVKLARQTIADSFKPTWVQEMRFDGAETVERTYLFRGRRFFSRQVKDTLFGGD